MKKIINLIVVLVSLFVFYSSVDAAVFTYKWKCYTNNETGIMDCELGFTVDERAINLNQALVTLTTNNVTLESITLEPGWSEISHSKDTYTYQPKNTNFNIGYHKVLEMVFKKVDMALECSAYASLKYFNYTCMQFGDIYYGKDGTIVSYEQYDKECNHYCEEVDGKFYNKAGEIVSEKEYKKDCGKYSCEIIDGKYYAKNGERVDKATYDKECEENICEILDDGTIYGKSGTIVDRETYEIECLNKKYCEEIDGKYYDKDGNESTKEDYLKQCSEHKCKQIGNTYYDDEGNEVDKDTYLAICQNDIDNPDTGSILPYICIGTSIILAIGLFIIAKKYNKLV